MFDRNSEALVSLESASATGVDEHPAWLRRLWPITVARTDTAMSSSAQTPSAVCCKVEERVDAGPNLA